MYQHYFGLAEAPFSIAPDPRYLYLSERHQEALAHLLYGVSGEGGFVLLTGEVGAGKTTVCRCLLEQIPENCDIAFIFNPKLTVEELLATICAELSIAHPAGNTSIKVFVDCINTYLLDAHAKGRHTVLIIDEAQNLSADVLEQMRLLTNLETNRCKLLQIILLGQPELLAMLERPELRQLAQRIVARYHLGPLAKHEVAAYVEHRLAVAGAQRTLIPAAFAGAVYRRSGGVPRVINLLCDRALLGAFVQGKERVDRRTLAQAAREVFPRPAARASLGSSKRLLLAAAILLAGSALAWAVYQQELRTAQRTVATPQAAVPPAPVVPVVTPASAIGAIEVKEAEDHPQVVTADKLEWPSNEPRARSETLAYAAVFRAWGEEYAGTKPCRQAERLGLRCKAGRGGLDEVRNANRPAVLRVRDAEGKPFDVALTALGNTTATFIVGGETTTLALDSLAAQWSGDYTLLWRAAPDNREVILPNSRGPAVAWLVTQLAQVQGGATEAAADPRFDDAVAQRVKQFQLTEGLTPDGAIGPQTLIRLSALTDQAAPRLVRP